MKGIKKPIHTLPIIRSVNASVLDKIVFPPDNMADSAANQVLFNEFNSVNVEVFVD